MVAPHAAAFDTAYTVGSGVHDASDRTERTAPPPFAASVGANAAETCIVPNTFVANTRSTSPSGGETSERSSDSCHRCVSTSGENRGSSPR